MGHWWGLEFYNTTVKVYKSDDDILRLNETTSELRYVDIMYAGVDDKQQPVPAIRASPTAPHLIDVSIKYSALDATNFTEIKTATYVQNAELAHNRGKVLL